ncbi:hypothetical protein INT43_008874 [Umbelopsis isabellina]|uniref:Uncharacterized protein n=1 Tax=Mortierella isabellina TaxID=91625 RepID=A0A8H7PY53_MORIS|nr:hypothetical protein INT43_008874 [Umbelopsis isabellina]
MPIHEESSSPVESNAPDGYKPDPPSTSKHYPSQPPMTINTAKPALRAGAELLELVILYGQKMSPDSNIVVNRHSTIDDYKPSMDEAPELQTLVSTLAGNPVYIRPELQSTKLLHSIFHSAHYENNAPSDNVEETALSNNGALEKLKPYVSLYTTNENQPVWALTDKSWHDMVLVSQEPLSENTNHRIVSLSTSATLFKFQWADHTFQWELKVANTREGESQMSPVLQPAVRNSSQRPYDLQCYNTNTQSLVAEFTGGMKQFVLWSLPAEAPSTMVEDTMKMRSIFQEETSESGDQQQQPPAKTSFESNTHNPFKNRASISPVSHFATHPFTSFLIASGLLINDHVSSLLQSLGGGNDALRLILDPDFSKGSLNETNNATAPVTRPMETITDPYISRGRHHPNFRQHLDDASSIAYSDYTGMDESDQIGFHHNSRYSVKSIELNPGCCHCYWGHGFWWKWCPLCVPGGWCERVICGGGRPRRRW